MTRKTEYQASQRVTNEKPIPRIPLSFDQTIAAALETPPERKKPKKQALKKRKK
jgi:hypothetical protein